jgi:hypothetical protein
MEVPSNIKVVADDARKLIDAAKQREVKAKAKIETQKAFYAGRVLFDRTQGKMLFENNLKLFPQEHPKKSN